MTSPSRTRWSVRELSIGGVARTLGIGLPPLGGRSHCPFRKHRRRDKSFKTFASRDGTELYICFSCDPPLNVGDAVGFYAVMTGMERSTAWKELLVQGYAVPRARAHAVPCTVPPPTAHRADLEEGTSAERLAAEPPVLPLTRLLWKNLCSQQLGGVERFARQRFLDPALLRELDVVDVRRGVIGFGYRTQTTGPCSVKCRATDRKVFWILPRPSKDQPGRCLRPLYLADRLPPAPGDPLVRSVLIVEGETDALAAKQMGFENVVSLPDGARSASKVDVDPISRGSFGCWLIATDNDKQGEAAYRTLRRRASRRGIDTRRVRWTRGTCVFKDANEALMAGFASDDFERCLAGASKVALP